MNLVNVYIEEIIEKPKKVITDDFCGWVVKVLTNCYGTKKEKTFTAVTRKQIDIYIKLVIVGWNNKNIKSVLIDFI
jgi:hypothetical protein